MLEFINGTLLEVDRQTITLQVAGVGLKLFCPTNDQSLLPAIGNTALVYTALFLKETNFELFGFTQKESRNMFYQLMQVSGIGPKTALHILSTMSLHELYQNINANDVNAIAKVPGLGKKTAQRLIIDLKSVIPETPLKSIHVQDALLALKKLGFSEHVAKKALEIISNKHKEAKVDELITLSLKHLS